MQRNTGNMEILRKQRGTVKAKLTRLERKVENDQRPEAQVSREQIEVYTSRLEEIRGEFDDVQRQIVAIQVDERSDTDEAEDEEFEDRYLRLKIQLKQMVRNVPILQNEARGLQNDDVLVRVLQQQAELMQQLGNNNANGAQAANNDAIYASSHTTNRIDAPIHRRRRRNQRVKSEVTHCQTSYIRWSYGRVETFLGNFPITDTQ